MQWNDLARAVPEIAAEGERRFHAHGFGFLGTIRHDGVPRISPIEITFAGGRLVLGMPHKSLKALDLKHDPRCTIHCPVTKKDNPHGDFKLSGIANEILDESFFEILADMAEKEFGSRPPFRAAFYVTIDITSASLVSAASGQVLVWTDGVGLHEKKTAGIGD